MITLTAALQKMPVIGILRGSPPEHIAAFGDAALRSGFGVLEVTLDSADPFDAIENLATETDLVVGAGTVHSAADAVKALSAGARFIVSPHFDPSVVAVAKDSGAAAVPGAATPTEIWTATKAGADLVKVFPAHQLGGPAYLAAIRGPLGNPQLVPTGGVDSSNAAAYLAAGATALGIGGSVFPRGALEAGDIGEVERRCRNLVAAIQ